MNAQLQRIEHQLAAMKRIVPQARRRFGAALAAAIVVGWLTAGCAAFRPVMNPAVYQTKKLALAAYYGPVKVESTGGGLVSAIQSQTNKYGTRVAESTIDEVFARLQGELHVELMPMTAAPQSADYAGIPTATYPEGYIAPRGMKAVSTDQQNDPALAKLAKSLGVDAVIVVKGNWQVQMRDEGGPIGYNRLEVLIVGADGTRLLDATGFRAYTAEGASDTSVGSSFAAAAGAMTEESAVKMSRAALRASLDKFLDSWRK